jgi:DNA-binding transcriptional ArsR family regulator
MFVILRTTNNNKQTTMICCNKSIDTEKLARFAKALGHPTRIEILCFLVSLDSCYFDDIQNELPIVKATVSQHLKELKDAGLIHGEIETPKVKYCINRENWEKAQQLFSIFFESRKEKISCSYSYFFTINIFKNMETLLSAKSGNLFSIQFTGLYSPVFLFILLIKPSIIEI